MKLVIKSDVRIATAGGEALFLDSEGVLRGNEVGRSWQFLKAGTEVALQAAFDVTDTYFVTISVAGEDGEVKTRGAVLRAASWEKVKEASA